MNQERNWFVLLTREGRIAGLGADRAEALAHALRMRRREAAWLDPDETETAALEAEDQEWAKALIEGEAHWTLICVTPEDEADVTPDERPMDLLPVLLTRGVEEEICRVCGCTERESCEPFCLWVDTDLCSACVADDGFEEA